MARSGGFGQPGPRKFTTSTTKGELLRPVWATIIASLAMIMSCGLCSLGTYLWDMEHGRDFKAVNWVMDHPWSFVALTVLLPICISLTGLVFKMRQETQDGHWDDAMMTRPRVWPLTFFGKALYGFFEFKAMWRESRANKQDPDDTLPGLDDFGEENM